MPTPSPLHPLLQRATTWRHLDLRTLPGTHAARAWGSAEALVAITDSPPLVHAIGAAPFDPTAELLSRLRDLLPERFELRAGPAAGGIVTATHHAELLGPMERLTLRPTDSADPTGLVPLSLRDAAAIEALPDKEHHMDRRWLDLGGWFGVQQGGQLIAAMGPRGRAADLTWLAPPRVHRRHGRTDLPAALVQAVVRRTPTPSGLDERADHRARIAWLHNAGATTVGHWERWWCVRRGSG